MQRQHASGHFDMKDWAVNCISLAEYHQNNAEYAQALYLLRCGESIVPPSHHNKLYRCGPPI